MRTFLSGLFRYRRRRSLAADLIASLLDFAEARALATPAEIAALEAPDRPQLRCDEIAAAVAVRLILARAMTDAELTRYIQHLQNRYLVVVGPATYAKYSQGVPSTLFSDRILMDAEVNTLSYRLRLAYNITEIRDGKLSRIRTGCAAVLFVMLLVSFGCVVFEQIHGTWPPLNYLVVACLGLAGAATSIARRADTIVLADPLEEDPVLQASALDQGMASLFVAGLCGPVFGLVVLLLFLSKAFNVGDVTPVFLTAPPSPNAVPDFRVFASGFWLKDGMAGAELAFWAFVAGFAEQLVPDVLDRFGKTSTTSAKSASTPLPQAPA